MRKFTFLKLYPDNSIHIMNTNVRTYSKRGKKYFLVKVTDDDKTSTNIVKVVIIIHRMI